jgi:hypothetical protein
VTIQCHTAAQVGAAAPRPGPRTITAGLAPGRAPPAAGRARHRRSAVTAAPQPGRGRGPITLDDHDVEMGVERHRGAASVRVCDIATVRVTRPGAGTAGVTLSQAPRPPAGPGLEPVARGPGPAFSAAAAVVE